MAEIRVPTLGESVTEATIGKWFKKPGEAVAVDEPLVDLLLTHFRTLMGLTDAAAFRERFDVMSVQRNLKALGTFGYQATTKRNATYVPYMDRTLRYVRGNLARYPRFARLRELLSRYLPELA